MLFIDIRVVQTGNRLLNSLGNVALLRHTAARVGPVSNVINRLQFRGGEIQHRENRQPGLANGRKRAAPHAIYSGELSEAKESSEQHPWRVHLWSARTSGISAVI